MLGSKLCCLAYPLSLLRSINLIFVIDPSDNVPSGFIRTFVSVKLSRLTSFILLESIYSILKVFSFNISLRGDSILIISESCSEIVLSFFISVFDFSALSFSIDIVSYIYDRNFYVIVFIIVYSYLY